MADTLIKEQALAQLIVSRGLALQEHVKECISQIEEMHSLGANPLPSLAQMLLIKGYIDGAGYDRAMKIADETSALQSMMPSDYPPDVQKASEDPKNDMEKFIRIAMLGKGGMGEVWKAWEKNLRRYVAIKFFRGHSFEDQKRFLREAQVVGQLNHPNIASVHEIAMHNDEPYLVMQLINGTTIDKAGLEMKAALKAIRDAAFALDFAHEHGFVHRDIKPANIMLEKDKVYLMDFGLARPTKVDSSISESGAIMGTPQYMSPEQARGESKLLDIRSDIYSLGATLYTLVCHRHAFDMGQDEPIIAMIRRIIEEEPLAPRRINPNVPWEVETIVLKAMEKDRERRYQSAKEMGEDIQRFLDGEPIRASRAKFTYRLRKKVAKHSGVFVTLAMLIVLGLGFGTYVLGSMMTIETKKAAWLKLAQESEARQAWEDARVNYERAVALDPDDKALVEKAKSMEELARTVRARLETEAAKAKEYSKAMEVYHQAERDLAELLKRSYARGWDLDRQELDALTEIVERCNEQMKKTGESGHGRWVVGRAYLMMGDWSAAQEAFDSGVAAEPGHMLCLAYQARLAVKMGVLNESAESLQSAAESLAKVKDLPELELDLARAYALVARRQPAATLIEPLLAKHQGKEGWEELYIARALSTDGSFVNDALQAAAARPGFWESYFLIGLMHLRRGDQRGAIGSLEKIFAVTPQNLDARLCLGLAHFQRGDYSKAIEQYDRAAEIKPKLAEVYLRRGLARRADKDLRGAIQDFTRAIDARAKIAEAYTCRGMAKRDLNDLDGAISDFTDAIKADPNYSDAYAERGNMRRDTIDLDGAYADCDKAVQLDPRSSKARTYLGLALEAQGERDRAQSKQKESTQKFDRAIEEHGKAIDLAPFSGVAYCNRGRVKLARADLAGALQDFNRAIELSPNTVAEAYVLRGMVSLNLKKTASAEQDFNKAREIHRNIADAYLLSGDACMSRGEYVRAIAEYDKAVILGKGSARGYMQRGTAKLKLHRRDEALADYSEAIRIDPQEIEAYEARAKLYLAQGNRAAAAADLSKMIEINPGNPAGYERRAKIRLEQNDCAGAIQDYTKVVEFRPNDSRGYIERGRARQRSGSHGGAIEDWSKAISLEPACAEAYELRAQSYRALSNFSAALADYGRAAQHGTEAGRMHVEMGTLRELMGDDKGALKDYDRAVELSSGLAAAFTLRGSLHFRKHNYYKAKEDLDRALQLAPNDPQACVYRAEYFIRMNATLDAIRDLNRAVEHLTPENKPLLEKALLLRAGLHFNRGDMDGVIGDCSRIIEMETKLGRPYYFRGEAYQRKSYTAQNETRYNLLTMAMNDFKAASSGKDLNASEQQNASTMARSIQAQLQAMAPKPPPPQQIVPPKPPQQQPPQQQPPPPPPGSQPPPPGSKPPPPPGGDPFRGPGGYKGVGR